MSSLIAEDVKSRSEVYHGDEMCQVKSKELLKEIALPNGLLPLKDMEECGYDRQTGFVWLKQKKSYTHKFDKIGKLVSYAPEVTAHVQQGKITKLTGVKTKELLLWITLSDIYVDDPPTGKITFKTPAGLFRSFPVSAFEIQEEPEAKDTTKRVPDTAEPVQVKELWFYSQTRSPWWLACKIYLYICLLISLFMLPFMLSFQILCGFIAN